MNNFLTTMPYWLQDRLVMPLVFQNKLGVDAKIFFIPHHLSHAASSYFASGFEDAAIMTVDGVGEWATLTCGTGRGTDISIKRQIRYPDSIGLVYTAVTAYLGFEALEGEGIVMGLAAYGSPEYYDDFRNIVRLFDDGSFSVNQRFFGYFNRGSAMFTRQFIRKFGPPRLPGEKVQKRHCDMAATVQKLTQDILCGIALRLHNETGSDSLCLAGGVALNCVANSQILEATPFKQVYIQPAAGDAGGALGAAAYAYHSLIGMPRMRPMETAYLGPDFDESIIKRALLKLEMPFRRLDDNELYNYVGNRIAQGAIAGWFQGRMEYGPRALGNRSILADARDPAMKDTLNYRVKHREPFRPYAPVVKEERVKEYFCSKQFSAFMLLSAQVLPQKRDIVPSVTHVDGSARVQTVNRKQNERLWLLLDSFEKLQECLSF